VRVWQDDESGYPGVRSVDVEVELMQRSDSYQSIVSVGVGVNIVTQFACLKP
jgi:hypothetical protein